jgi:hypothetical protein
VIYAAAVAVACWAVGLYGAARFAVAQLRMMRGRTVFPVPGVRVASARVTARLADLPGESGSYRGLLWARTADGIACRASGQWFSVIGECRQDGDEVVVDAIFPHSVRLSYIGLIGFGVVMVSMVLSSGAPRDWAVVIPIAITGGVAVQYVLHLRRARATGRLLPHHVQAACTDATA